ncbi:MAG: 23S rRNA (adenine(2503)-C(2))-methyltransferase RlmN, partial [Mammaliicoccus vitulinus]
MPNFERPSIYSLELGELEDWLIEQLEPKFRAKQIFDWLYVKRVNAFSE